MSFMERLKILWPGSPLEDALWQRAEHADAMRADLADMIETSTQLTNRRYHDVVDEDRVERRRVARR